MTTNSSLSSLRPGLLRAGSLMIGLILLATLRAGATTYAPMADRDLADRAAAIALVTVGSSAPAPARTIAIDYLVQVDQVIKGDLPGSAIVVRVPGGVRADGIGLKRATSSPTTGRSASSRTIPRAPKRSSPTSWDTRSASPTPPIARP